MKSMRLTSVSGPRGVMGGRGGGGGRSVRGGRTDISGGAEDRRLVSGRNNTDRRVYQDSNTSHEKNQSLDVTRRRVRKAGDARSNESIVVEVDVARESLKKSAQRTMEEEDLRLLPKTQKYAREQRPLSFDKKGAGDEIEDDKKLKRPRKRMNKKRQVSKDHSEQGAGAFSADDGNMADKSSESQPDPSAITIGQEKKKQANGEGNVDNRKNRRPRRKREPAGAAPAVASCAVEGN